MILKFLVFAFLLFPVLLASAVFWWDDFYSWLSCNYFDEMNNGGDFDA